MNFNSDYQSHQNRLCNSEVVNLSLNAMKTKTKFNIGYKGFLRIMCEIAFVFIAISLGYMQGLKSFSSYNSSYNEASKPKLKSNLESNLGSNIGSNLGSQIVTQETKAHSKL